MERCHHHLDLPSLKSKDVLIQLESNLKQKEVEIETFKNTLSAQRLRLYKTGGKKYI